MLDSSLPLAVIQLVTIHSFSEYLSIFYAPGTVLSLGYGSEQK